MTRIHGSFSMFRGEIGAGLRDELEEADGLDASGFDFCHGWGEGGGKKGSQKK